MPEYIERDAALAKIEWLAQMTGDSGREHGLRAAIEVLQACAAADVEPVRHGYWAKPLDRRMKSRLKCSECGSIAWASYDYCPNCGAKMDGKEADHENVR